MDLAKNLDLTHFYITNKQQIAEDTVNNIKTYKEKYFKNKKNNNMYEDTKIAILKELIEQYYGGINLVNARIRFFKNEYQSLQEQISNTYNTIKASIQSTIIKFKRYLDCVQFYAYQKASETIDVDVDVDLDFDPIIIIKELEESLYNELNNDFNSLQSLLNEKVYVPLCKKF